MSETSTSLKAETEGRRVYVRTPFGHPAVAELKQVGAKWDPETKRWWVGVAKRTEVERIVAESAAVPAAAPAPEDADSIRVQAKVKYKSRTYYQRAASADGQRVRLCTLDLGVDFWADLAQCELLKTYAPREVRSGYGRHSRTEHTTLGSIRRFVAQQRRAEAAGEPACAECGRRGGELVRDLEDGQLKHRGCCDIPPGR